jgi:hypothetical protein
MDRFGALSQRALPTTSSQSKQSALAVQGLRMTNIHYPRRAAQTAIRNYSPFPSNFAIDAVIRCLSSLAA